MIEASRQSLGGAVGEQILKLFPADQLTDAITKGVNLEQFADAFVSRNGAAMDAIARDGSTLPNG